MSASCAGSSSGFSLDPHPVAVALLWSSAAGPCHLIQDLLFSVKQSGPARGVPDVGQGRPSVAGGQIVSDSCVCLTTCGLGCGGLSLSLVCLGFGLPQQLAVGVASVPAYLELGSTCGSSFEFSELTLHAIHVQCVSNVLGDSSSCLHGMVRRCHFLPLALRDIWLPGHEPLCVGLVLASSSLHGTIPRL